MSHDVDRDRSNRAYYLAQGRCPQCGGKSPLMPGYKMCEQCRKRNLESKKKLCELRKSNGLCTTCGKPIDESGYATCSICRKKRRDNLKRKATKKKWYSKMREDGRCVTCGNWAEPGRSRCKKCLKMNNENTYKSDPGRSKLTEKRRMWRANGLCVDCGRPTGGFCRCKKCTDAQRDRTRKYKIMQKIRRETANV